MEFEESIYNLIPKEQYVPEKQKRYKSQYPADLQPTSSTFGLGTTSKPVCSNLSGKFNLEGGSHYHKGPSATFGQAKGALQPKTDTFKKKGTGNPVLIQKQEVGKKQYEDGFKRQAVPKKDERPIHGLVSDKNFIVANAVEAILSAPALPQKQERDYLKKKNFGKVPKYVGKIKAEIEDEYNMVREMQIEEAAEKDRQKLLMPEGERQELIAALKKKWECLHIEYQQQTHYTKYDTLGKKNRNEALMREMDQIESDIKKLSKNYIFVDTTQPSSMW